MELSFESVKSTAVQIKDSVTSMDTETAVLAGGALIAGAALLYASRGRASRLALADGAALPQLEIGLGGTIKTGGKLEGFSSAILREQTTAELVSEKTAQLTFKTAKEVLRRLGKYGKPEEEVVASDEVRKMVFNRFLSRLDQERYILHGSYGLESQGYIVRKAVKDIDLLAVDPKIVQGSRTATSNALVKDLQAMVSKPSNDGLTFEVPPMIEEPLHIRTMYPRMRHAVAIAKDAETGTEIMRIPLDIRIGANTILPPSKLTLKTPGQIGEAAETVVSSMAPEENFAYKLFSYTNRTIGGQARKPKDLMDMASMVEKGLDEHKVTQALQAWTKRGYNLGPLRHPGEVLGPRLAENMAGQTPEQLVHNLGVVKNFYLKVAPQVEQVSTLPKVLQTPAAQVQRFFAKQFIVYPVG